MDRILQKKLFTEINGYYEDPQAPTRLWDREVSHLASTYIDPEYQARERAMMLTQPLIVGHSVSVKNPGDFFAHDDAGVPILVSRQADGTLKAFLNICRHRGARVCPAASGNAKLFTCPYHAWTYRSDGRLLAAPKPGFPNIDPAENSLVELPVEERHGLVWAILTPGLEIDVAAHLGALDEELSGYPMTDYVLERDTVLHEEMNWKYVLDGFLEVYHIPSLHSESIAPYIHGRFSPFDAIGQHSRLLGIRKSFDDARTKAFEEVDLLKHVAVNYQVFPNTIVVWQGDHFELWTSYPGKTPYHCTVRIQSLVSKEMAGDSFKRRWDRNWKILIDTVAAEDWPMSREIQASLQYVGNGRVLFGRNEPGLQHFHGVLDAAVRR